MAVKLFRDEAGKDKLLIIDSNLTISKVDLGEDFKIETITNCTELLESSGIKVRSYDKIVNFMHFNSKSGHLFISFFSLSAFLMIDTNSKNKLIWNLPRLEKDVPLCAHSDQDKLVVCYDSNKVQVFDLLNKKIHDWSKRNMDKFPQNFLNRFNRFVGITAVSTTKYILYTNYTYIVLDLTQDVPSGEVSIIQNHPGKSVEEKSLSAKTWFDNLKISQAKYLGKSEDSVTA